MTITLNNIRSIATRHKFFLVSGSIVVILITIITVQQILRQAKKTYAPPPASQQPVTNGKLDISAPTVQQSKSFLDTIRPKLPYNQTITTSTGTKVSYAAFLKTPDQYELFVEISGIDFTSPKQASTFAQTVQDFRETADAVFNFLAANGVNPSAVYIIWADSFTNQKTAESWLQISDNFPKVIKQNGKYIFENSK